ncbi:MULTISPECIES: low molecular weight protein-tyrosine-phosphatase [unclassified Adlercreutzia]|uniref:low molecular weight protein-tyrosine-phosphatase n=1 Tax=unclassified Adlercreutzia TaxID=2636013 RepID=UPI0013EDC928|nr:MULTISPECIES: low molecular weight protein-tyrosine-phosphatase [unclassified Adlercreutzia]
MKPTKILFVCHGNICRSPMAEFVMRDLVEKRGLADVVEASSAATSSEELGNPVHHGTRRKLASVGISCAGKTARRLRKDDYARFNLLIGMDEANVRNMRRLFAGDPEGKVRKLLEFAGSMGDIADPWYTGDFDATYRDVLAGCTALLDDLEARK